MSDTASGDGAANGGRVWPTEALKPPRVVVGNPKKPVPWAFTTVDRVRVWDEGRGFVELRDLAPEGEYAHPNRCVLSADGLELTYPVSSHQQSVHYALLTGDKRLARRTTWGEPDHVDGPSGEVLAIERVDVRPRRVETGFHEPDGTPKYAYSNEAWGGRYVVKEQNGSEWVLPVTAPLGANQGLRGAVAQFCDSGRLVAVSHRAAVGQAQSVSVTDWRRGIARSFDDVSLAANSVWSPDATRLVVGRRQDLVPQVLEIETGSRTGLRGAFDDRSGPLTREVIGWLDNQHLIVLEVRDRRLLIGAHELTTGKHHPLLDTSLTSSLGEFGGVQIAPNVLHALPDPFGLSLAESPRRRPLGR